MTRSAPATTALATPPPEALATCTSPATRLDTLVVVLGMNNRSASKPFFLYKPRSLATYQTELLLSKALCASLIFSCAGAAAMPRKTAMSGENKIHRKNFITPPPSDESPLIGQLNKC